MLDKIKGKLNISWEVYYPVVAVCYVITVFTALMRPGVVAAVLMLAVGCCAKYLLIQTCKDDNKVSMWSGMRNNLNMIDAFAAAFAVYCIISVIWLRMQGLPLYVYTGEFATFLLPLVFYVAGRIENSYTGFYKGFLIGFLIICAVGLIFYIWAPQFYLDYLYNWSYISLADAPTMRVRMNSVCGSTVLGALSVAAMLIGAAVFTSGKNKKLGVMGFFAGFVFALLSNQRSAMFVAILIALYINMLAFFTFKVIKKKYFYIEVGAIAAVVILIAVAAPGILMKIFNRLVSLPQAVGERSEQWVAAVNMMFSSWIGNGLGANGHRALGIEGVKVIADGGLVKMFCELGVVGISIFIYMLLLIYKRGLKSFSQCYAELGIIAVYLLQSIGSNTLSFQLVSPVFWYAVGRCVYVISQNSKTSKEAD